MRKFNLKKEFVGKVLERRIGGKMKTFNTLTADEKHYEFYFDNGFRDCFTVCKPKKVIEFTNNPDNKIINNDDFFCEDCSNCDKDACNSCLNEECKCNVDNNSIKYH